MLNMNELRYLAIKSAANAKDTMTDSAAMTQSNLREGSKEPGPYGKGLNTGLNPAEPGYGSAIGMGAGVGALGGIPLALLAHALMAGKEKRGLRDYLKSGLLGALLGGGVGAGIGAGKHYLGKYNNRAGIAKALDDRKMMTVADPNKDGPSIRLPRSAIEDNPEESQLLADMFRALGHPFPENAVIREEDSLRNKGLGLLRSGFAGDVPSALTQEEAAYAGIPFLNTVNNYVERID